MVITEAKLTLPKRVFLVAVDVVGVDDMNGNGEAHSYLYWFIT
jgi:hypothetical protein